MSSWSSSPSSSSASSSPSSPSSSDQNSSSFFSRMEDLIKEHKHSLMKSIKDFKRNLKSLQKSWLQLNAKTSNVEDQIKLLERSGQKKRKRDVEEWLIQVKSIENEVAELHTLAESHRFIRSLMDEGKLAQLNGKVVELIEQSKHLDGCGTRGVELLTNRMVGKEFEENCKSILSLLARREVSSIGIHGMGGVGKTALAKCINNRLIKQSQVRVFWIVVSQEFTIKDLQDKIACFLGLDLLGENDEDLRAVKLHKALSQMKNSVLILDDVWKNIDMLKVGCPVSKDCCRLIITTRSFEVCHMIRCQKVIGVNTLRDGEEWKLFSATLNLGTETELSPDVERIAESVLGYCDGLPLGIITVAENMRGKTSIHTWKAALAELEDPLARQGGIGDDEIFRVLKSSFDRLNDQSREFNTLQLCFLYCSLFPQGNLPDQEDLVDKFISEGLMDGRKSRRAQVHQGYSILYKLLDLSLLVTYHNCIFFKMHNLVRVMALKINEGKYLARAGHYFSKEIPNEEEWRKDLEKVSLMLNGIRIIPDGISPDCPNLSTLILYDNPLEVIPDSFFSKMQGLCTLDLSFTLITMLPDSLSELRCLKALNLESCEKLEKVPYLGKMKALRELNLSSTAIEEVPQGVEELCNLKFLSMAETFLEMLPTGLLLKLVHLEYLRFPSDVHVPTEEIVNLVKVDQFWGRLNDMQSLNRFIKSRPYDAFYHVQVGEYYCDGGDMFGFHNKEACLSKCNLEDKKVLIAEIESLTFRECEGLSNCLLDYFQPRCYRADLKALAVVRCGGIECLLTSSHESPTRFSTLKSIQLESLQDFRMILKTESGAAPAAQAVFPHLKKLTIKNCNEIRKLGLPIQGVPSLAELEISKCGEIEEIFEDDGSGSVTLPKLIRLRLDTLPRLKCVCKKTVAICNPVRFITILQCPSLMKEVPKLPQHLEFDVAPPPSSEREVGAERVWWKVFEITVEREWWESLEWDNPDLLQLLQPFVKFEDGLGKSE